MRNCIFNYSLSFLRRKHQICIWRVVRVCFSATCLSLFLQNAKRKVRSQKHIVFCLFSFYVIGANIPATYILLTLLVIYFIHYFLKENKKLLTLKNPKTLLKKIGISFLIIALLTISCIVPFIQNLDEANTTTVQNKIFGIEREGISPKTFFFKEEKYRERFFYIGIFPILIALSTLLINLKIVKVQEREIKHFLNFSQIILIFFLCLMSFPKFFLLPFLGLIQFEKRFFLLYSLSFALLVGIMSSALQKNLSHYFSHNLLTYYPFSKLHIFTNSDSSDFTNPKEIIEISKHIQDLHPDDLFYVYQEFGSWKTLYFYHNQLDFG